MKEKILKLKDYYLTHKFIIDCVLLSILFLVNCFTHFGAYLSFTLLYILILTSDLKSGISYIFFSLPFTSISIPNAIILAMICLVAYIIKLAYQKFYIEKCRVSKRMLITLGIFLIYLIFPFKNIYNADMIVKILAIFAVFILLFLCVNFPEEFRLKFNISILAYGLVVSYLFGLLRPVSVVLQELNVIYRVGSLYRYCGLFETPNVPAMICEMALALLGFFIVSKQYDKKDIVVFILFTIMGVLTLSKTFFILLVIMLLTLLIFNIKSIKKIKRNTWIIFGIIAVVGIILCVIFFKDILFFVRRFLNLDVLGVGFEQFMNTLTTTRYDLWKEYVLYLIENPLILIFGRGLGAPIIGQTSPHNMYLSTLYQMGIIGVALFIYCFIQIAKSSPKPLGEPRKKFNKALILPLLVFAVLFFSEDLIFFIY